MIEEKLIGEHIVLGLKDLTEELGSVASAINDKQVFDEKIGSIIKEVVEDAVKVLYSEIKNKTYYDDKAAETISSAITQAVAKISSLRIDVSPIIKMAADIAAQNQEVLNAVLRIPKPESSDASYRELIKLVLKLVEQNQEILNKQKLSYKTPEKQPANYRFTVTKSFNNGGFREVEAKVIE